MQTPLKYLLAAVFAIVALALLPSAGLPALLHASVAVSVYTPITGNPSYKLVFDDEFNGNTLNTTTKWYPLANENDTTYWPGNYGEKLIANVTVNNGLSLAVTQGPTVDGYQYGTAGIVSRGTTIAGQPINVYWEAEIKNMDNAYGLASAWWTDTAPSVQFPEADFSEYWQSQSPDQTRQNYNDNSTWVLQNNYNYGSDLAAGYHVYGCLWTPTAVTMYIDGVQTSQTTTGTNQTTPEFYAWLNATVSGNGQFPLPNGTTQLPNYMLVKYVHVYSAQAGAVAVTPDPGYAGPGSVK